MIDQPPVMQCGPCRRGHHDRCRRRLCECQCGGWMDLAPFLTAAAAARASAWTLMLVSVTAMGGTFAAIDNRDWSLAWQLTAVMLLLAWAAGHERAEQRACEEHQLDVWMGAWA